jgi:hypothetical protein
MAAGIGISVRDKYWERRTMQDPIGGAAQQRLRSRRDAPGSGKIQQDAVEVDEFSQVSNTGWSNQAWIGRKHGCQGDAFLLPSKALVDCHQRAQMRCSLRCWPTTWRDECVGATRDRTNHAAPFGTRAKQ